MQPGEVLYGKYHIESKLGQGSFGAVYRARQTPIDRTVAIKVLIPRSQNDEELRHRFKREAKLSSQLNSPHSIKIHDFGELEDNRMFLVMEFLEGTPLDKMIKQERAMPPMRVARIAHQVLLSLDEAHKLGIVHRDLKPENIFICSNMQTHDFVKVFDFGIAKVVTGGKGGTLKETAKLTMAGGTVGTPAYMSPEQCYGKALTGVSDLYSLGIVMYEMLTGRLPFENANPVQTMMRQINDPPPAMPEAIAATGLGQAVMKVLEKKPEGRFVDAAEFAQAVEAYIASGENSPAAIPSGMHQVVLSIGDDDVDDNSPTLIAPAFKDEDYPAKPEVRIARPIKQQEISISPDMLPDGLPSPDSYQKQIPTEASRSALSSNPSNMVFYMFVGLMVLLGLLAVVGLVWLNYFSPG